MKIVICSSIDLTPKLKVVADELKKLGHEVELPFMSQKILAGEVSLDEFLSVKDKEGDGSFRAKSGQDLIMRYFKLIEAADAILVVNGDKKGIKNYIGGNTFLEMGFAHVLGKKIFLLNPLPDMPYRDELEAVRPVIINNDLNQIK